MEALCANVATPLLRIESEVLNYGELALGFSFAKALVIHNDGGARTASSIYSIISTTARMATVKRAMRFGRPTTFRSVAHFWQLMLEIGECFSITRAPASAEKVGGANSAASSR